MSLQLRGVIPPVPTIIGPDGHFDGEGMGRLIDRLVASDVNGFLFLGSAGEFAQISNPERRTIAEFCVKRVAGKKPVIIGAASCSTAEVIELSRHAGEIGADAVMVVNPYYSQLTDDRIYAHYRQIAEASPIPVMLYNFPALTGQDLSSDLVCRLASDCPNIVGIKDTVDCMSHIRRMIQDVKAIRPDFMIFCGYDEYLVDTLLAGGDGAIPATSNFAPEVTCGIYQAYTAGDLASIQTQLRRLGILSRMYAMDRPFTGLIKESIRLCGLDISTALVAPATPPGPELLAEAKALLLKAGLSVR